MPGRAGGIAVALLLVASVLTVPSAAAAAPTGAVPSDPPTDTLGWEAGYWYDESIDIDRSDGLNESELDAVVARAMARVEHIRRLEFEERVPVEIISRSEYRERTDRRFANATVNDSLHQNVKFEALFMVGEDTDAISLLRANNQASVLGYYDTGAEEIVIVSDSPTSLEMNEITLAQELFHALQDQHFDFARYDYSTEEQANAVNGLVEGDGNYVDYRYEQRCLDGSWGACLMPRERPGGGDLAHAGLYVLSFQPYSDGPSFVEYLFEQRGWAGVNAAYDDPPASTEQVIHPPKYRRDEPTPVSIDNRSAAGWRVLELPGTIDYAEFGEAGIFSMFVYPTLESRGQTQIVTTGQFFNQNPDGSIDEFDPYSYDSQYSAGWDGDKLLPYVTNDSATTNETGYVWKTIWDSRADAREFSDGYRQLLDYHDAEPVGADTFVVPEGEPFADAFRVTVEEDTVTIVNAPTVADLSRIRSPTSATPSERSSPSTSRSSPGAISSPGSPDDPAPTPTVDRSTPTVDRGTLGTSRTAGSSPSSAAGVTTRTSSPGFGVLVTLAVLVLALGRRVRR